MNGFEIIGYAGSILIAVSLMMKSMLKLRWINLFGASTFAVYGFIIDAYPVLMLNSFISLVDIVYLFQMHYKKDYFEIFQVNSLQTAFVQRFLAYYREDIAFFFPGVDVDSISNPLVLFTVRNMLPVGLFIGAPCEKGILEIKVEYAIPDYRDLKNAFYLYENKDRYFLQHGYHTLHIVTRIPQHVRYIQKIGFQSDPQAGDHGYSLKLA